MDLNGPDSRAQGKTAPAVAALGYQGLSLARRSGAKSAGPQAVHRIRWHPVARGRELNLGLQACVFFLQLEKFSLDLRNLLVEFRHAPENLRGKT